MSTETEEVINRHVLEDAMSYQEYRDLIDSLLSEEKTTGDNHSEDYLHYTRMNVQRMNRLEKKIKMDDELKKAIDNLDSSMILLTLTEAWCGDAAQNIVLFRKMEEYSDNITLKLLLRDETLEIMDQYLTNGGRAIPKVIALDEDNLEERWTWGPRPEKLQEMYMKEKDKPDFDYKETARELQKWYAKDKTKTQQAEVTALLKSM